MATAFRLEEALLILERIPAVLTALLAGLPAGWSRASEGPDTWSPYDVVGHLIHGERTDWIPRTRQILAQGESVRFEPFDRFAQFRSGADRTLEELLATFAELRAANVTTLRGFDLDEERLALPGEHPALGPVTLRQLLATWTAHDLSHLMQVGRVMARRYADDVGPWIAYLPAVQPRSGGGA